ncbi:MAG: hypothetical protein AMJ64_00285, partial [Betaproteobacteria bacterium SG8_39]
MRRAWVILAMWAIALPATAQLDQVSNADAVGGLKAALEKGAV